MIVTDLRDQRLRQELLAESNRKDEFLAMLAHELRNPLAPIRNALALMDTPELPKPAFDWARQVIDRQVNQLVRLLDDLLDVQRFSHGVIDLQTKVTELGALIEGAVEALRSSATAKEQDLRVERWGQPLFVMADSVRLTQVISNLLVNAVKYSPPNSHITVSWKREGRNAQVRIADTGIGMAPELVEQVFNPFVQGDRDLSRSQGGLGLGLTLVKRLVELHGGSVKAASAGPGRGSEFTLTLPLLFDEASRPGASERPAPRAPSQPKRILVVDDNEDSAASLCALLTQAGHRTGMALDGPEALRTIAQLEPHVIILDIGLPGMDGFEVARRLHAMGALENCRLVALSGYGRAEDRERTRASGFHAHLVKPVEMDALLDVVESS
jgi:two-component system CheB/CheR fusion protein